MDFELMNKVYTIAIEMMNVTIHRKQKQDQDQVDDPEDSSSSSYNNNNLEAEEVPQQQVVVEVATVGDKLRSIVFPRKQTKKHNGITFAQKVLLECRTYLPGSFYVTIYEHLLFFILFH
jgi:hypothetical protein